MLHPASPLAHLLNAPMRPGVVRWIGVRPNRREPLCAQVSATCGLEHGLLGDHYRSAATGKRQVTLISQLDLVAIGAALGQGPAAAEQLRRNIVVDGINLHALRGRQFQLGGAVLEATGDCHPCSRMEEILGLGGYNAVRGHGGITARIVSAGEIRLGDTVARLS